MSEYAELYRDKARKLLAKVPDADEQRKRQLLYKLDTRLRETPEGKAALEADDYSSSWYGKAWETLKGTAKEVPGVLSDYGEAASTAAEMAGPVAERVGVNLLQGIHGLGENVAEAGRNILERWQQAIQGAPSVSPEAVATMIPGPHQPALQAARALLPGSMVKSQGETLADIGRLGMAGLEVAWAPVSEVYHAVSRVAHGVNPYRLKRDVEFARQLQKQKLTEAEQQYWKIKAEQGEQAADAFAAGWAERNVRPWGHGGARLEQQIQAGTPEIPTAGVDVFRPPQIMSNPFYGLTEDELKKLGAWQSAKAYERGIIAEMTVAPEMIAGRGVRSIGKAAATAPAEEAAIIREAAKAAPGKPPLFPAGRGPASAEALGAGRRAGVSAVKGATPRARGPLLPRGKGRPPATEIPEPPIPKTPFVDQPSLGAQRVEAGRARATYQSPFVPKGKQAPRPGEVFVAPEKGPAAITKQPPVLGKRKIIAPEKGPAAVVEPAPPKRAPLLAARARFEAERATNKVMLHAGVKESRKQQIFKLAAAIQKSDNAFVNKVREAGVPDEVLAAEIAMKYGKKSLSELTLEEKLQIAVDAHAGRLHGRKAAPHYQKMTKGDVANALTAWRDIHKKTVTQARMWDIIRYATGRDIPKSATKQTWQSYIRKHLTDKEAKTLLDFVADDYVKAAMLLTGKAKRLHFGRPKYVGEGPGRPKEIGRAADVWLTRKLYHGTSMEHLEEASDAANKFLSEQHETISDIWKPLIQEHLKSWAGKFVPSRRKVFNESLSRIYNALETGRMNKLSETERKVAERVKQWYDKMFAESGIPEHQYRKNYQPRIRKIVQKHKDDMHNIDKWWDSEMGDVPPNLKRELKFFAEHERTLMDLPEGMETNPMVLQEVYLRNLARRKFLEPARRKLFAPQGSPEYLKAADRVTELEGKAAGGVELNKKEIEELANLQQSMLIEEMEHAAKYPRERARQTLRFGLLGESPQGEASRALSPNLARVAKQKVVPDVMGYPTVGDTAYAVTVNRIYKGAGKTAHKLGWHKLEDYFASKVGSKSARKLTRSLLSYTYASTLGNVKSPIKNLTQQLNVIGEVGPIAWAKGLRKTIESPRETYKLAKKYDVITGFAPGLEGESSVVKSIPGTVNEYLLKPFSGSDKTNRLLAFNAGRENFLAAAKKGGKKLDDLLYWVDNNNDLRKIKKALDEGKIEDAAGWYGKWVSDATQWRYTTYARPVFARGPAGALVGQFGTWGANEISLFRRWLFGVDTDIYSKNAMEHLVKKGMPRLARYTAAVGAVNYAAKKAGVDLSNYWPMNPAAWMISKAANLADVDLNKIPVLKEMVVGKNYWHPGAFSETPIAKAIDAGYTILRGFVDEEASGSIMGRVSEGDVEDALKELERGRWAFIPAGSLVRQISQVARAERSGYKLPMIAAGTKAQQIKAQEYPGFVLEAGARERKTSKGVPGVQGIVPIKYQTNPYTYFVDRFLLPMLDISEAWKHKREIRKAKFSTMAGVEKELGQSGREIQELIESVGLAR